MESQWYKNLFHSLKDALFVVSDLKIVNANQAASCMFKLGQADQLVSLAVNDLAPHFQNCGELSSNLTQRFMVQAKKYGSVRYSWLFQRLDSEIFAVDVNLAFVVMNRKPCFLFTLREAPEGLDVFEGGMPLSESLAIRLNVHWNLIQVAHQCVQGGLAERITKASLFDQLHSFIFDANSARLGVCVQYQSNIIYANPYLGNMFDFDQKALQDQKSIKDFFFEGDYERNFRAQSNATPMSQHYRHLRFLGITSTGRRIQVDASLSHVAIGSEQMVVATFVEINTEYDALRALKLQSAYFKQLVAATPEGIVLVDNEGGVQEVNKAFEAMFGYEFSDIHGKILDEIILPKSENPIENEVSQALDQQGFFQGEVVRLGKGGVAIDVSLLIAPVLVDGKRVGAYGIYRNICLRKQAESKLLRSEALLRHMYNNTPVMLHTVGEGRDIINVNSAWLERTGYSIDEVIGQPSGFLMTEASRRYADDVIWPQFKRNSFVNDVEYQWQCKDGRIIDVLLNCRESTSPDGHYINISACLDVTEQKQIRRLLDATREQAQVTLAALNDGVIRYDSDQKISYMNPVAASLTGWPAQEAHGMPFKSVFQIQQCDPIESIEHRVNNHLIKNLKSRDGTETVVQYSQSAIRDSQNAVIAQVVVFKDVSERFQIEKQLAYQASHDALTGLSNRYEFEARIRALIQSNREGEKHACHALLFIDLDQFKVVNDSCGHRAGDELLKQLTAQLKQDVRRCDLMARLGGDEFGLLLPSCSLSQAQKIARKIVEAVREFRFVCLGRVFAIGASAGLVEFSADETSVSNILARADSACYDAKEAGGNRVKVFSPEDSDFKQRQIQMNWVSRITEALEDERFTLYLHPVVALNTPINTAGYSEALLRMIEKNGDIVLPQSILSSAERFKLMPKIDRWVIDAGFRQLSVVNGQSVVGFNVSASSLRDEQFIKFIAKKIDEYALKPQKICFEIHETAAIGNLKSAINFVTSMRDLGCKIALDDFGNGFSSFNYIKELHIDYIKIDGDFVRVMESDQVGFTMVKAIAEIARVSDVETIAKFVDTESVSNKLKSIGVNYAQGYYYSKPVEWLNLSG